MKIRFLSGSPVRFSRISGMVVFVVTLLNSSLGADPCPETIFNGKDLSGWTTTGSAVWKAESGILKGGQDGDSSRWGLILTEKTYRDFDLSLDFKIDEHGKYNSGVYLRHQQGTTRRRGYQVNIGRGAAGEPVGLYLDEWLDEGDKEDKIRKPLDWNQLRIRARGVHIETWLNGEKIVDYTDPNPAPELLQSGAIAFQTYGAEGHAGWVEFRNIKILNLDSETTQP